MFWKDKHDIVVSVNGNEYFAYFNYDFVEVTKQEMDSEGNLLETNGYECTSYGKKFTYYPSREELIGMYNEIAIRYGHSKAEEPTIFIKGE